MGGQTGSGRVSMEEVLGRLNYLVLGKDDIISILGEIKEAEPEEASVASSTVSINRDGWIEQNMASTMSVHFRILSRVVEKRFSEQELSDKEVMDLARYLSVTYVDNLLGYNRPDSNKLKRFYIGCAQLQDFTSGHPYSGSIPQFYRDFTPEERHNMVYTSLARRWDEDKVKHFRYLTADYENKRVPMTAVALEADIFAKVEAVLIEIYSRYRMGNEAGQEIRDMIRNNQELATRDRKAELGLHCQNLRVGNWTLKKGCLGIVYLVVETSITEKDDRPGTVRTRGPYPDLQE